MAKIEMDHTDVRADSTKQMSELKLEVKELRRLIRSKNRELDESLASLEHMQQNGLVPPHPASFRPTPLLPPSLAGLAPSVPQACGARCV